MEINNGPKEIFRTAQDNIPKQGIHAQYNSLSTAYHEFVKNVSKGDFANAPNRYIIEKGLIAGILELCEQPELSMHAQKWAARQAEVLKELAKFGLQIQ